LSYAIGAPHGVVAEFESLGHAERAMQSITQDAQRTSLLFSYGVLDAAAVIAWADEAIVQAKSPSNALLDLSMAAPDKTEDILSCLHRLSAGAEFWPAFRSALPQIRDFIVTHPDRADAIANDLFLTACSFGFSDVPDDLRFIYRIDDAFSMARDGTYGDRNTAYRDFIDALEKFTPGA
jgi:hypothetical protein